MKKMIGILVLIPLLNLASCNISSSSNTMENNATSSADSITKVVDSTAKATSDSVTLLGKNMDNSLRSLKDTL